MPCYNNRKYLQEYILMNNKIVEKTPRTRKFVFWCIFYPIILVGIISLLVIRHFNIQNLEQQYTSQIYEITSQYGLNDVYVSLINNSSYSSEERSYNISIDSDGFGKLEQDNQYEILNTLSKIHIHKSNIKINDVVAYSSADSYRINTYNVNILNKNSKDYYNYKDKKIITNTPATPKTSNKTPSYTQTPTDNEKLSAWSITTHIVEQHLKSPSTAKFPPFSSDMSIKKDGNYYQVISYVDAENSLGAKVRTLFVAEFEMTNSGYKSANVTFAE